MSGYFDVKFGNWLPDDGEEARLVCECPACGQEFYEGDDVLKFEGECYCDASCLADHLGAYNTQAELEEHDAE